MWTIVNGPLRLAGLRCGYRRARYPKGLIQSYSSANTFRGVPSFPGIRRWPTQSDVGGKVAIRAAKIARGRAAAIKAARTKGARVAYSARLAKESTVQPPDNEEPRSAYAKRREGTVFSSKDVRTVHIYWKQASRAVRLSFKERDIAKDVKQKFGKGEYCLSGQPIRSYNLRRETEDPCGLTLSFIPAELSEESIRASIEEHNQPTTVQFSRRLYDHDFNLVRDAIKAKLVDNYRLRGLWSKPTGTIWGEHAMRASFFTFKHACRVLDAFENQSIPVGQTGSVRLKAHLVRRATCCVPRELYESVKAKVEKFREQWGSRARVIVKPVRAYIGIAVECDLYDKRMKSDLNDILASVAPDTTSALDLALKEGGRGPAWLQSLQQSKAPWLFPTSPSRPREVTPEPLHVETLGLQKDGWKPESLPPTKILRHEKLLHRLRHRAFQDERRQRHIVEERRKSEERPFLGIRRTEYAGAPVTRWRPRLDVVQARSKAGAREAGDTVQDLQADGRVGVAAQKPFSCRPLGRPPLDVLQSPAKATAREAGDQHPRDPRVTAECVQNQIRGDTVVKDHRIDGLVGDATQKPFTRWPFGRPVPDGLQSRAEAHARRFVDNPRVLGW